MTCPLCLVTIFRFGHLFPHSIRINQCPLGKLKENSNLVEDVEVGEFVGTLLSAIGVAGRCFRDILSACVFIEYLWTKD